MTKKVYVTTGKPKPHGAVFRAPAGTAIPKTVSEELPAAYKSVGYISEDGVTNSNSPSSENIKAWGGDVVDTYQTEKPDTYKFTMIEALRDEVMKAVYGDKNVSGDLSTGITVKATSDEATECVWVIDQILRGNVKKRIVIPSGKVTAVDDIVYKGNQAIGYPVTITAMVDDNGVTHYDYTQSETAGGES